MGGGAIEDTAHAGSITQDFMSDEVKPSGRGIKWLIVAIPVWLALSGGVGLWLHFRQAEKERQEQKHAYRKDIDEKSLVDDFTKITRQIGPRHHASEAARLALMRMAAMIEGAMGPNNMGYEVKRIAGQEKAGITAPLLTADVLRRKTKEETWLVIPYDSPVPLRMGQASASAVAVSFAVAQSLIGQSLERNVRFLYVPMAYADEQDRRDCAAQVHRLISAQGVPHRVLVLGGMLHEGKLQLVSMPGDAGGGVVEGVKEIGENPIQGPVGFSTLLLEKNLPAAVLRSTRIGEWTAEQEDEIPAGSKVMVRSAEDVVKMLLHLSGGLQKK